MLANDHPPRPAPAPADAPSAETRTDIPALEQTLADQPIWRQDPPAAAPAGPPDLPLPTQYIAFKAVLEFCITAALFFFALPFIALAAALVKLTSRGPVFYSQVRLGKDGRLFRLHKIRTMLHDCERTSGPRWSVPGDPRITPIGRFLRKTHLDELPQLWNVLRGDMSLVGPRPERPELVPPLEQNIPHYRDRLLVRPGVTGLAQVQLPADTDLASVRRKLAYDLYYIRHMGLWLDLRLMACTGAHMAGVPFYVLFRWFRMPHRDAVEHHYEARRAATGAAHAAPVPAADPA